LTLLATDLADILVTQGLPFREAHEVVGNVVRFCLENEKRLQDLSDLELRRFSPAFPKGTAGNLSVHGSVHQKKTVGGTSPKNVVHQGRQLRKIASGLKKRLAKY
jgi:argininosuccinate lyase